jgi:GTP-dependent phosphoenolpyruvate carboxykinase
MASQKAVDNAQRLRYIRALERFHKSILSYLANTLELTRESYVKKITNAQKVLKRVDEIALYKGELQDLQKLVKKMCEYKDSQKDIQDIKDDILYSSNQLDKSKNAKRYKKDKHSQSKFNDWE